MTNVIYIPRVGQEHAYLGYFRDVFHSKDIGWVARVDFGWRKDGSNWRTATVYMYEWYESDRAWDVWDTLSEGKQRKLYYNPDTPWWYWAMYPCKDPVALKKPAVPEKHAKRLGRLEGDVAQHMSYVLSVEEELSSVRALAEKLQEQMEQSNRALLKLEKKNVCTAEKNAGKESAWWPQALSTRMDQVPAPPCDDQNTVADTDALCVQCHQHMGSRSSGVDGGEADSLQSGVHCDIVSIASDIMSIDTPGDDAEYCEVLKNIPLY